MSDSISEIDLVAGKVTRTIPLRWGSLRVLGGMPNALAIRGKTLYVADGGDNAVAEVDLDAGAGPRLPPRRLLPRGHRPEPRRPDGLRAQHQGQRLGEQDDPGQAGQRPRFPGDRHRPST